MNITKVDVETKQENKVINNNNSSKIKLSVIVALRNNDQEIDELYSHLNKLLQVNEPSYELIFVDDGSDDDTHKKLKSLSEKDSRIVIIRMRSEFGESSAFDAGFKHSSGNVLIYFTARVRINPEGLAGLLSKLNDGYDMAVGWRYPRRDAKLNQFISKGFNAITRKLSQNELHDMNSGVLITKKEVLENIDVYGDFINFVPILAIRQGYKVAEEKIEQLPGKFRKSRYFKEYLQRILDIITVIFLTNYSKKPIHFLGFVGAVFTIIGSGIEIYLFIYRILGVGPIAGRPLLLLGTMLLVIGIQMISIGLIGEMIIFTHAREIQEYNIEEVIDRADINLELH